MSLEMGSNIKSLNHTYLSFQGNDNTKNTNATKLVTKPIKQVENAYNKTIGKIIKEPENQEDKKSHKKAITVGSTVLVISALAMLLNPKVSSKLVSKMQTWSKQAEAKMEQSKDDLLKTKFYSVVMKVFGNVSNGINFLNTINAGKDIGFKWLCSAEKFKGVKNDKVRNVLQKINNGFTSVMTKLNNGITNWFDKVGKKTIYRKYSGVNKKLDSFEETIKLYKKNLNSEDQKKLDNLLQKIAEDRKFLTRKSVEERLLHQEELMKNLEPEFKDKLINGYIKKFKGFKSDSSFKDNWNLFKNNLSFWAEDMMKPVRTELEQNGKNNITKLVGNGKDTKGYYQEIVEILSPHIGESERKVLEKGLKSSTKRLNKANHSECAEYFDKKRDLMLGGAPTDVLTNCFWLGMSGLALSQADTKEDKISKALTLGFPAVAGIGTSIAMTAMLFSGTQGMALGALAAAGMSKMGSIADKHLNPKKPVDSLPENNLDTNNPQKLQEKLYA